MHSTPWIAGAWLVATLAVLACAGPRVGPDAGAGATQTSPETGRSAQMQARIDEIDTEIAEKKAAQAAMKPPHSRWQVLQRDISRLEIQRDQLLLMQRVEAGEGGEIDPRADSALHVVTIQQGDVSMSTAAAHALHLHASGSITCVNTRLVEAGSDDASTLEFHLRQIAAGMPREPLDPEQPDGPTLPVGTLKILIEADAPHGLLQRVLQECAGESVQIWKFTLVATKRNRSGRPVSFALPQAHEVPPAVEEGAERDPAEEPLRIRIEPIGDLEAGNARWIGESVGIHDEGISIPPGKYPGRSRAEFGAADGESKYVLQPVLEYPQGVSSPEEGLPAELAAVPALIRCLEGERRVEPERWILIEAEPGTRYGQVAALLEVLEHVGFETVTFQGIR